MEELFKDFVSEAKELIGAELTNLYVITDSPDSTTPILGADDATTPTGETKKL